VQETHAAAEILGAARVEFLGYADSGMMGRPTNDAPESFWQADVAEAAAHLAVILREERADVLTVYDENGGYGHPDHIQVHRVGVRAAELAGTPKVYLSTIDRDRMIKLMNEAIALGDGPPEDPEFDMESLGVPGERITMRLDVTRFVERKRQAMIAHGSQISDSSWFLTMAPEAFAAAFGEEDYVLWGAPEGTEENDLFEGLG
ncbi:MAG: PIG-L family deacetylase, partial [Actinobacteria bacterium]|nr:PIG-L family deacetylase [Actinomycetota bacterium]